MNRAGWFVVSDNCRIAGTLDEVLAHPEHQGEYEPELPEAIRAGIVAMVEASGRTTEGGE